MIEKIYAIAIGALYGGEAALIGYLKSEDLPNGWKALLTKEFWATFDLPKAMKTVIFGAVLGAFIDFTEILPESWKSDPSYPAYVAFVPSLIVLAAETVVKAIMRRTPLMRVWNGVKDAAISFLEKLKT